MFYAQVSKRGVTLIDTLVGIALIMLVFVGIFGVFTLSIDVVTNNKARIGALALANEEMEYLRSIPYDDIGTEGGIPSGSIPQSEIVSLNNVNYTRNVLIIYLDKEEDGLGGSDENGITADVKQAKVSVTWDTGAQSRTLVLVSEFAPKGIESNVPGGTISVSVVDANSVPIQGASVRILNEDTIPTIDVTSGSDENGEVTFIGAPSASNYQITVSKAGYNSAQTYSSSISLPNPSPGHLTVVEDQTTSSTFSIDTVGTFTINTFLQIRDMSWTDSFVNENKISTSTNTEVVGGSLQLAAGEESGSVTSETVQPGYLYSWKEVSWDDATSTGNTILYHVYLGSTIVPDSDLPGNSVGFSESPIDISGLASSTYPILVLKADLMGDGEGGTPSINSWQIDYKEGPDPLPSVEYALRGSKTIGLDGGGGSVYKYDESGSSGASASVTLIDMEWDVYELSIPSSTGYDVAESCVPQPNSLNPAQNLTTNIYLVDHTNNSLLVDVRNINGDLIQNASVELSRGAFSESITSSVCGQAFFGGMSVGTVALSNPYTITVNAAGYQQYVTSDVEISGTSRLSVVLVQ